MRKLLLILSLLLTSVSGAWADTTITLVDGGGNNAPYDTYGTKTNSGTPNLFTTNAASGVAGLVLSAPVIDRALWWSTYCLTLKPSATQTDETITLSAPEGYYITGLSMTMQVATSQCKYDVTVPGGSVTEVNNATNFSSSSLEAKSVNITFKAKGATLNWLAIKALTVSVKRGVWVPNARQSSIPAGGSYMIYNAHYVSNDSRAGFVGGSGTSLTKPQNLRPSKMVDFGGSTLWRIEDGPGDGQYYLCHENTGYHYNEKALSASTKQILNIGSFGSSTTATTQSINADNSVNDSPSTDTQLWAFEVNGKTGYDKYWNGNANAFVTWENSHPYAIYSATLKYAAYSLSDLSKTKTYTIANNRGWWAVGADATEVNSTTGLDLATDYTDSKQQFAFIQHDGYYYLYSVSESKFAYVDGTKLSLSEDVTDDVLTSPVTFVASTNSSQKASYPVAIQVGGSIFGVHTGHSPQCYLYDYDNDTGNASCIFEVGSFDPTDAEAKFEGAKALVDVTYNLVYNENTIATQVIPTFTGEYASSPWTAPAYCTLSDVSDTEITEAMTVNVTMTSDDLPFTLSSSYADATWYYLKLRSKYVYFQGDNSQSQANSTKATATATADAALWAFMGDPYNGILVINRAAGSGKYLDTYNYNDYPRMGTTDDEYSRWILGTNGESGFTLHVGAQKYINDAGNLGVLGFWNSSYAHNDGGSSMKVEDVDYFDIAFAYIDNYEALDEGDPYFAMSSTTAGNFKTALTTAFGNNHAALTSSIYENTVKPSCATYVRMPETGLYRIRSNYTGYNNNTGKNYLNTTAAGLASVTNTDGEGAGVVIGLTKNDDGTYYIQTQGDYLQTPTMSAQVVRSTTPVKFTPIVSEPGVVAWQAGNGAYGALHRSSGNVLLGWGSSADASKWTVEDAPTSVSLSLNDGGDGYYYATLCLPFDVTLPEGTYAYTLTLNLAKTALTLSDAISEIPAGTPVFLRGGSSPISATIGTGYSAAPLTTTSLTGTYVNKSVETNTDFFLGKSGGKIGFYTWDGTTLLANRAYLTAETVADIVGVKGFAIDWDLETAINAIANGQLTNENGSIYNLAGQRVLKAQKGIFVKNGRKVVVK